MWILGRVLIEIPAVCSVETAAARRVQGPESGDEALKSRVRRAEGEYMTRKAGRWIRCAACGEPANTLSNEGGWCLRHAAERHVPNGGWAQFGLRARILVEEPVQRRRRRLRLSV